MGAVWSVMTLIYHFSLLVKLRLLCDRIAETVISSTPVELIGDRIKFKFYAADKHMGYVKELEAKAENFDDFGSRIKYEIEIEDLLSHLIGSLDALLFRIDKKLSLGLPPKDVRFKKVSEKLDSKGRQDILQDWTKLRITTIYPLRSWLTILIDIRNTGTHINLINKRVEVEIGKSGPNRVCFAGPRFDT